MNKGYILKRLLRSAISVLIIMVIVFTLVYTLVPRGSIFAKDDGFRKLASKPDEKTEYMYNIWQKLGYLEFVTVGETDMTFVEQHTAMFDFRLSIVELVAFFVTTAAACGNIAFVAFLAVDVRHNSCSVHYHRHGAEDKIHATG